MTYNWFHQVGCLSVCPYISYKMGQESSYQNMWGCPCIDSAWCALSTSIKAKRVVQKRCREEKRPQKFHQVVRACADCDWKEFNIITYASVLKVIVFLFILIHFNKLILFIYFLNPRVVNISSGLKDKRQVSLIQCVD